MPGASSIIYLSDGASMSVCLSGAERRPVAEHGVAQHQLVVRQAGLSGPWNAT
jgi:hypothetical protein